MPCYNPVPAYRSIKQKTPNGKAVIEFKAENLPTGSYETMTVPCGQCNGCRLGRSKEWALRCIHEALGYDNNCVITLTIAPEHISNENRDCMHCPIYKRHGERCGPGSLCKKDYQDFMKRLRKRFQGKQPNYDGDRVHYPIRYFMCGEYGDKYGRPHFHACLFNFDFDDRYFWKRSKSGARLYRSETLESLWTIGNAEIGELNWSSAAYIARYCTKKVNGEAAAHYYLRANPDTGEFYYIEPEYIAMSRRPGVGYNWLTENSHDCYPKDFLTHDGIKYKIPTFYDKKTHESDPDLIDRLKVERRLKSCRNPRSTEDNLRMQKVQTEKAKKLIRSYENGPQDVLGIRFEKQDLPPASVLPQRRTRHQNVHATVLEDWIRNARLPE